MHTTTYNSAPATKLKSHHKTNTFCRLTPEAKKATKKRDTFVVSRWRGGARVVHAPRISSGASASDREKSGRNDQRGQSDDDREDDRRDGSDLKGSEHAEAREDNDQGDENGSRGGGLGHGGGRFQP